MTIEWETPPKKTAGSGSRRELWAELEANPGKWAVYSRSTKNSGGVYTTIRAKGYEQTTRSNGDGTITIYVRKPASS